MRRAGLLFDAQKAIVVVVLVTISSFATILFFLQTDPLLRKTRRLTKINDNLSDLTIVPSLCPPTKVLHTEQCPKVACVPISAGAGLGHRINNLLAGYIFAQSLGLPMAGPRLEGFPDFQNPRRSYPGADELFRMDDEIVGCPMQGEERIVPEGWMHHEWKADGTLNRNMHFGNNISASVNSLPFGNPNLDFTGSDNDGCDALEYARKVVADASCYSIFIINEFWPRSFVAGYEGLRSMYKGHLPETREALLLTKNLMDDDKFNVAFHIRDGDVVSNPKTYFEGIFNSILRELSLTTGIQVKVIVFSESVQKYLPSFETIAKAYNELDIQVIGGGKLSPVQTFIHFLSADVFVGSDSSFSAGANKIAGGSMKPVVIASPDLAGNIERNYASGNLIGGMNGIISDSKKILEAAERWKLEKGTKAYRPSL